METKENNEIENKRSKIGDNDAYVDAKADLEPNGAKRELKKRIGEFDSNPKIVDKERF